MKKLLTLLIVAASFAACEGPMGPMGPQGRDGKVNKASYTLTVEEQDWIRFPQTGPFEYYYYRFEGVEELTPYVINNGLYYMYFNWKDNDVLVQEGLGRTLYLKDDGGNPFEQNIACDYKDYAITFYVAYSDFVDRRPQKLSFRFVVFW